MSDDEVEIARIAGSDPVVPHRRHRQRPTRLTSAPPTAGKMVAVDKTRKQRKHHEPDMTPEQHEVLERLGDGLAKATPLAHLLGRTPDSVNASLYALQRRGLAERVPRQGWRRA